MRSPMCFTYICAHKYFFTLWEIVLMKPLTLGTITLYLVFSMKCHFLFSLLFLCSKLYFSAELERQHYLQTLGSLFPTPIWHIIKQEEMFDDVIRLYRNNLSVLAFPVYRNQHSWCHAVNVKWSHPSLGKSKFIHFLCLCKNTESDSNAVVKH